MDKTMKSACFEEITHLICDADKKVTISDVSNNWNMSHRDGEQLLLEWIETNKTKSLSKEFLIRGVRKNGNCVITVLAENKLDSVQKKFDKFSYSLYSVELASQSDANRLHAVKVTDCKWINLPLKHVERDVVVKPLPIPHVEKPTHVEKPPHDEKPTTSKKDIQSMFAASKPITKTDVKKETEDGEVKTEKETPIKPTPKKKEPAKSQKAASGKSAISSFFSKPSTATTGMKKKEMDQSVKKELPSPNNSPNLFDDQSSMDVDKSEENLTDTNSTEDTKESTTKKNSKRSIIDVDDGSDEIPCTPQDKKKAKKSTKKTLEKPKHTRIMKIEDSSDDEESHEEQRKLLASPVKEKENKTPPKNESAKATEKNGRRKGRKTISRTYKDEEGYLVTKNETVEYSCSDEEADTSPPPPPAEPIKKVEDVSPPDGSEKATKKKKISPPKSNTKQGSILSFFSKK